MCATPMPRIEPRVSWGSADMPMRMLPGTGVLRTICTPGCVMSSVDCGTSTGADVRRTEPGAGVGIFLDGGTGVAAGNSVGSAGGFDDGRGRTMISPDVASCEPG